MEPKRPTARVRELGPADWRAFRALRLDSLVDAPDAFGSTSERERAFSEDIWRSRVAASPIKSSFVAELSGASVGLVHAQVDAEHRERAWLMAMWVRPTARRHGVARAMVESVIAWARARRARALMLRVVEGNLAAEALYLACGFAPTGETEELRPGSSLRAQTMQLDLR